MSESSQINVPGEVPTSLHKIYTSDPLVFKSYVNKEVSITTEDSSVHTGVVYTVDPVSESVILMNIEDKNNIKLKILMGHAIKDIQCNSSSEIEVIDLFAPPPMKYSDEEIIRRKSLCMELLLENRFPVIDEKGILKIKDNVLIQPPYTAESCVSTNTTILNRIQSILQNL